MRRCKAIQLFVGTASSLYCAALLCRRGCGCVVVVMVVVVVSDLNASISLPSGAVGNINQLDSWVVFGRRHGFVVFFLSLLLFSSQANSSVPTLI